MSFTNHLAAAALKRLGAFDNPVAVLDSCTKSGILDAAGAADYAFNNVNALAVASVQEWANTAPEDLGDGENMAQRLVAFMVGVADNNQDGEITEDEAAVIDIAMNATYDYLVSKGVSEEDASALLNDEDSETADRVAEFLKGSLPQDDEGSLADLDAFVFDSEAQESLLDSACGILDAVYKRKLVVRNGKKVKINKRVSGTVVLSAKQKIGLRKAHAKSHSASARMNRMKSLKVRARSGLDKKK